ncbi:MAG: PQQ-like beta-propeller repeat protein [Lentisphaeria bacterium]|nr:PQQ-like beta-propeller repeat protein [Lentisphaeria bacterium]
MSEDDKIEKPDKPSETPKKDGSTDTPAEKTAAAETPKKDAAGRAPTSIQENRRKAAERKAKKAEEEKARLLAEAEAEDEEVDDEGIPGFVPLKEDQNPVITHLPHAVADDHRPIVPGTNDERKNYILSRRGFIGIAKVSLLISLIIYIVMFANHVKLGSAYPVDSVRIHLLENELRSIYFKLEDIKDKDERAAMEIEKARVADELRVLDLDLRENYFMLLNRKDVGVWALFIGIIIMYLTIRLVRFYWPHSPSPVLNANKEEEQFRERRFASFGLIYLLIFTVIFILAIRNFLPGSQSAPGTEIAKYLSANKGTSAEKKDKFSSKEDFAKNWPAFRGFAGNNYIKDAEVAFDFDVNTGKHVAWLVDISLDGVSSPAAWGRRVFITGANKSKREFYCYNSKTGKKMWTRDVGKNFKKKAPTVFEENLYASPTPVTDGERVYAIFANGDLMALNANGSNLWEKNMGLPDNAYGHSASLLIHDDKLIVQWDHKGANSGIYAFHLVTGKELWKVDREEYPDSWSSPILSDREIETSIDGKAYKGYLLLTVTEPGIQAHNPDTGEFLWEYGEFHGDNGPSPIIAGDKIIFNFNANSNLIALNFDGTEAWKSDVYTSGVPSPVSDGIHIWLLTENADFTCLKLEDGSKVYAESAKDFGNIYSTPLIINDKILLMDGKGKTLWVKTGPKFEIIQKNTLNAGSLANAAILGNSMYIRDGKQLLCIRKTDE